MPSDRADASRLARSERGIALLAALSFLILMALIAGGLLLSVNSDRRMIQQTMGEGQALNVAEAGVAEATERIRTGEIPSVASPRMVAQIYLCGGDEIPALGPDTLGLATWQNPGGWLRYSTPGRSGDVLTVRYKTDAQRRRIYRFDDSRVPTVQTVSGSPIFVVTATGQEGDAHQTIITELARASLRVHDVNAWAAVVSGGDVTLLSDAYLCGYEHRADTPAWTGVAGRTGEPRSCNEDPATTEWESGPVMSDRYGVWAAGDVEAVDGGQYGSPAATATTQSNFYAGCWQVLNMTQSDVFSVLGPVQHGKFTKHPNGLLYYTGDVWASRCDGDGLLYVEGDLHIGPEFAFRGLVYATGRIVIDGSCWVLGSMVAGKGVTLAQGRGRVAVLYSSDTIEANVTRYAARFVRLSWREQ